MRAYPKLNIIQRAINKAGRRFAIAPFPFAFMSTMPEAGQNSAVVFNAIYRDNYWLSTESGSGGGSELESTANYRRELIRLLLQRRFSTMFDAPCGDLNWMPEVLRQVDIVYRGGDIASSAVCLAKSRLPEADIRHFDITIDQFPNVNLWHCRDTFFHLSFDLIWKALKNFARSDVGWALLTTHRARVLKNMDIPTGGYRLLDLERPPFNLPRADAYLRDYRPGEFPRFVGLWPADAIRSAVAKAEHNPG